jgi:hypothetical protein
MNKLLGVYYTTRLFISIQIICYRYKTPFKYIVEDLTEFINNINIEWLNSKSEKHNYIVWKIEYEFIPFAKKTKLVERRRFESKLDKIIK